MQGFEPRVLSGLRATLRRDRPLIWLEISDATIAEIGRAGGLMTLVPENYLLRRFTHRPRLGLVHRMTIEAVREGTPTRELSADPRRVGLIRSKSPGSGTTTCLTAFSRPVVVLVPALLLGGVPDWIGVHLISRSFCMDAKHVRAGRHAQVRGMIRKVAHMVTVEG